MKVEWRSADTEGESKRECDRVEGSGGGGTYPALAAVAARPREAAGPRRERAPGWAGRGGGTSCACTRTAASQIFSFYIMYAYMYEAALTVWKLSTIHIDPID